MGFEIDLFIKQPDSRFLCKICSDVVENPIQCSKCDELYCNEHISHLTSCPNCLRPLKINKINRHLKSDYDELQMNCPLKSCKDVFQIQKLEAHFQKCQYVQTVYKYSSSKGDCVSCQNKAQEIENMKHYIRELQGQIAQQEDAYIKLKYQMLKISQETEQLNIQSSEMLQNQKNQKKQLSELQKQMSHPQEENDSQNQNLNLFQNPQINSNSSQAQKKKKTCKNEHDLVQTQFCKQRAHLKYKCAVCKETNVIYDQFHWHCCICSFNLCKNCYYN